MAVPKKKVSISKIKKRYIKNNKKILKNRKINYNFLELIQLIAKKENWMPLNLVNQKKNKYKILK